MSTSAAFLAVGDARLVPRPSELDETLSRALISGGDPRLAIDPKSGLNAYGCAALPRSGVLAFSSSTASTISPRGFAAAEATFEAMFAHTAAVGAAEAFESAVERTRRGLRELLELDACDADIVFSPSGTDSAIQALYLTHRIFGGKVTSVIVAADETGNGVPLSAAGRHFNSASSAGAMVEKGQQIAGVGDEASAVCIAARDACGARSPAAIDADVRRAVAKATASGHAVALHVMHHSKLGTRAPSDECIGALRAEHGAAIQIIVDACQFRLSRRRLRHYLDRGFLVLVTGSKFFTGPALSGGLIVPEQFRARISGDAELPRGLADYTSYFDWPASLHAIKRQLPRRQNVGALLRWVAAIEEMRAYFAIPGLYRGIALREFAAGVVRTSERHPEIELLPEPAWLADETDVDDEFSARTIFPFVVSRKGKLLSLSECRAVFRALNVDVRSLLDRRASSQANIAAALCHIGQPVPIPIALGGNVGALRISADARTVSDCFAGGDMTSAISGLTQKLAQVETIFQKVRLLANNLERLLPVFGAEP